MTALTPGSRWRSQVSAAEVIVVRAGGDAGELTCGGAPMVPVADAGPAADADGLTGATQIGKRYSDPQGLVEVLCTKGGAGALAYGGVDLVTKAAKALPASD